MSFNEPPPQQPGRGGYEGYSGQGDYEGQGGYEGYSGQGDYEGQGGYGEQEGYGEQGRHEGQGGFGDGEQQAYGAYDGWADQQPPQSPHQQSQQPPQTSWGAYEPSQPRQEAPQPSQGAEPEPPRGGGKGKLIAVLAVVAALLVTGGVGLVVVLGDDSTAQAVRLTTPKTLHDGDYVLQKDSATLVQEGLAAQEDMPEGVTSVAGQYGHKDDAQSGLVISGGYGDIGDTAAVQDGMFKGMLTSSQATVATVRKDYTVGGQTFSCEVVKITSSDTDVFAPVCTWADASAAAMAMDVDARTGLSLATVNVEEFARVTAQIKAEVTVPVE